MRVVAADWSGAARAEQHHLWLAECAPADGGPARLTRLEGLTRLAAADRLIALADSDPALVAGLDFGFSLPAWYLAEAGIATADELWADPVRLERWLAECAPPFWGRPGRRRPTLPPDQHWRRTETAAGQAGLPRPKSVFQIGGSGAVGTASLRGMPILDRLRRAGFAVWPMDTPRLPVVLEAWPRLHTGPLVKSQPGPRRAWLGTRRASIPAPLRRLAERSPDALDAAAAALGLATTVRTVVDLPAIDDPVVRLEGWIWGVPLSAGRDGQQPGH
ncbi:MAG TPA: hypothetical protein VKQ71_01710 [Acidimicrobiales bacterium]|nr:hypothetical protein [Acidimicrobiales bacterium]